MAPTDCDIVFTLHKTSFFSFADRSLCSHISAKCYGGRKRPQHMRRKCCFFSPGNDTRPLCTCCPGSVTWVTQTDGLPLVDALPPFPFSSLPLQRLITILSDKQRYVTFSDKKTREMSVYIFASLTCLSSSASSLGSSEVSRPVWPT